MSSSTSPSSGTNPEAKPEATSSDYLSAAFPPSWDTLQKGLALFAVLVIIRSCLCHLRARLRRTSAPSYTGEHRQQKDKKVAFTPNTKEEQQSLPSSTIGHFRPYTHQRYPSTVPPWIKEPPKFQMDEGRGLTNPHEGADGTDIESPDGLQPMSGSDHQSWKGAGTGPLRHLLARPPPAPPLTPPELSHSIFTIGGRSHGHGPESFIHQPNPDYISASSSTPGSGPGRSSSPHARRFSYTKTIPIGVPIPAQSSAPRPNDSQDSDLAFSPSSYPPTSPHLPPPPPLSSKALNNDETSAERSGSAPREIDLQGQVVSVLDQDGAGWKRHTRVYGGGVCLACQAAGQEHGAGGFYGATVSPEEMR